MSNPTGFVGPSTLSQIRQLILSSKSLDTSFREEDEFNTSDTEDKKSDLSLSAPKGFSTSISNQQVYITWREVAEADFYRIKRSESEEGNYEIIADELKTSAYEDTDVESNHHYYYRVLAVRNNKESGYSTIIAVTVPQRGGGGGSTSTFNVDNQTIAFGAFTLADAGGVAPTTTVGTITSASITSGNGSGHWQIASDGTITPTATGDTADLDEGPYTLGVSFNNGEDTAIITITTEEDIYHILADSTELTSVLDVSTGGETIKIRPGTIASKLTLSSYGSGNNSKPTYTDYVTIRSDDTNNKAHIYGFDFIGVNYIRLQYLKLGSSVSQGGSKTQPSVYFYTTGTHPGLSNIEVLNNEFESAPTDGTDQAQQLGFASTGSPTNFKAISNIFNGGHIGVNAFGVDDVEIIGNIFQNMAGDAIRLGQIDGAIIGFNYNYDLIDDNNPNTHHDSIQVGNNTQSGDYTDFKIFGNVMDIVGSDDISQFIFIDDIYENGHYQLIDFSIVGNIARVNTVAGIAVSTVKDGIIAGNTIIHPVDGDLVYTPTIRAGSVSVGEGGGAYDAWAPVSSENVEILYNVSNSISVNDNDNINITESNNVTMTPQDSSAYNAAFADPYNSDIYSALVTKSSGTLDTSPIKTGADTTYFNYSDQKVDYPLVNIPTFSGPDDITDAETFILTTSAWAEVSAIKKYYPIDEISSNGALVRVSGGNNPEFRFADDVSGTNAISWGNSPMIVTAGKFIQYRDVSDASGESTTTVTVKIGDQTDIWEIITGVVVDEIPPEISSIASTTDDISATVTWNTNEAANSKVSYGTVSGTYTMSTSSVTFVTSHSLNFTSLSASSIYYYVVVSTDPSGNTSTSTEQTLMTDSFSERFVVFDGSNDALRIATDLSGASDNTTALVFISVDFANVASADEYLLTAGVTNPYIRRSSNGILRTIWLDTEGNADINLAGVTPVGAERANILLSLDANGTSKFYTWLESSGLWSADGTDSTGGNGNFDFTTGQWGIASKSSGALLTLLNGGLSRVAMWQGISLPDISNSAVQDNFANSSTGELVDPEISRTAYGIPIIDFYGLADLWNAGTNHGSGGDFTMIGSVTDVP